MKKIIYSALIFSLAISMANAKPVTPETAKTIAENFYKKNSSIAINTLTLTHTELSASGLPLYYIFDVNSNDGFMIVSAEDAIRPIIGYSTTNHSSTIDSKSNIGYWMERTAYKINSIRTQGLTANEKVAGEWTSIINNMPLATERHAGGSNVMTLGTPAMTPLTQTTWNQNGGGSIPYNNYCPGGSVTGCVATTMSQIMRYWSYPAQGTGSHSYTQSPNTHGYPAQSANFGATTYNWANMPLNASNADVAQLSYQCGVSVNMHYDPTGSGAQVLGGNPSAQYSYKTYFKYDPTQLRGLYKASFSDAAWIDSVESDLNIGRPVQYVGADSLGAGHTWVCDGYDSNGNLHMNWGWGGAYDGYFSVEDLTTSGGTPNVYDPKYNCSMLKGIVPLTSHTYDAGVPSIISPVTNYCGTANDTFGVRVKIQNFGSTVLTACTINYSLDGNLQTQNWNGSLVSFQSAVVTLPTASITAGTHTFVCYTSGPNGTTDQNTANDSSVIIITVTNSGILPIVEGFETSSSLPNANWNISHSVTGGADFTITSSAAATGSQSCMLNNLSNMAGNNSIIQTASFYDLTTFNTPSLTFKAAYQKQSTATNADKLQIFTSTDCGNSWISRKVITSTTLSSLAGGTGTSPYIPTPAQFTTYTVPIVAVGSSHNVMFRWEFLADPTAPGNNLYMDDINIVDAAPTGIENIETSVGLNLYPNPSTGKVNVEFNLSEQHAVSVTVTDMLGRIIETIASKSYESGETTLTIGANNTYQSGIYLVNINIDGQHISKKVVIQ